MGEKNIGHFFKQTILYNILAMNGLVSGYGSDSDDEEVTSDIKKSKDEDWMECMDNDWISILLESQTQRSSMGSTRRHSRSSYKSTGKERGQQTQEKDKIQITTSSIHRSNFATIDT